MAFSAPNGLVVAAGDVDGASPPVVLLTEAVGEDDGVTICKGDCDGTLLIALARLGSRATLPGGDSVGTLVGISVATISRDGETVPDDRLGPLPVELYNVEVGDVGAAD